MAGKHPVDVLMVTEEAEHCIVGATSLKLRVPVILLATSFSNPAQDYRPLCLIGSSARLGPISRLGFPAALLVPGLPHLKGDLFIPCGLLLLESLLAFFSVPLVLFFQLLPIAFLCFLFLSELFRVGLSFSRRFGTPLSGHLGIIGQGLSQLGLLLL